ncbi:unnamed protein product [Hydatigera taeniaeformis]|uniref:Uncharacterized protein n=1 Tax=Hydatigena taeniaeformis TaxID=6205 RepID=A0A158RE18_HYDTA|nr:unnamed protein product [Hydatigera taeniaeformis]
MNRLHQCTTQPTEEDNMRESETVRVDGMRWVMEWMHRGVEQRWCIIESPQKLQCCCIVMEDHCWTLERLRGHIFWLHAIDEERSCSKLEAATDPPLAIHGVRLDGVDHSPSPCCW